MTRITADRPKWAFAIAALYGVWSVFGLCSSLYSYIRPELFNPAIAELPKHYKTGPVHYFLILIHLACLATMAVAAFQLFKLRKSAVTAFGMILFLEAAFSLIELAWKLSLLITMHLPAPVLFLGIVALLLPPLLACVVFLYVRSLRTKGILA